MKIIKYLLLIFFIISFIIFLLPFLLKGILNIGNIAGMIVSLGCFLIIFFNKPLHHLIFSKIILSFIIILLAIISTCSYKILTNMNILPQEETTVVVLGCRVKNKKPSLALKERLDKTYQYLNENPKLQCILSGGQGANEEISEAKCMYQYLASKGIDPHRLYQEDKSTSTRENILFSYQLIKKENLPKAITIITNEFHEYRAQTIARRLNIKSYAISAHTAWWLFPTYFVREIFGIVYEFIL
ncbi:YdcF family protein [Faecalibacillus intestinalis]|uniref:YdcF family protein n=1 Tax=Faecalibacillus intestinalis TaxID=1982626 RepID=UPI0036F2761F